MEWFVRLVHKFHANSHFTMRVAMLLLIVGACILASSCSNDAATIWSAKAPSPDGHWVAIANTDQQSGPGTDGIYTVVSLKRINDSRPPTQILLFSHNEESNAHTIDMRIHWLTSSHLNVTYNGRATLDFQAIKCSGIDISVQNLSSEIARPQR